MKLGLIHVRSPRVNAAYRGLLPMEALRLLGHEIVWCGSSDATLPLDRLSRCDLVHVYRAADRRLVDTLRRLSERGVAISWDNDDDVRAISPHSPSHKLLGGRRGEIDFDHQREAIAVADLVTTTSRALAERFIEAGARRVETIENYLPADFAVKPKTSRGSPVIGYVARREHEADVRLLDLMTVFNDLLDTYPTLRIVTVGLELGVRHTRYEEREAVSYQHLPETLQGFDVGIAPLADISFNHARSNVKLKEYAACGVPWLASPIGEYAALGPGQGGRLVPRDGWNRELTRLIESSRTRTALRWRGQVWARRQRIEFHVRRWEAAFSSCIGAKKR